MAKDKNKKPFNVLSKKGELCKNEQNRARMEGEK